MSDTHTTAHIPDEAVQAAIKSFESTDNNCATYQDMRKALAAALPHLSAPCAVEVNDSGLVNYFKKMQEAAANYIEPTTYKKRFPKDSSKHSTEFKMPHEHHADSQKHIEEVKRDRAFIDDIICFLDCPEERRILSCIVTKTVDVAAVRENRRIICARLEGLASWLDGSQHSKWCGRKEVPIHGFSGEGALVREAITLISALSAEPAQGDQWQPTHRHVKRGTEYQLIGTGKMQAEKWYEYPCERPVNSIDMQEVAIYRGDDGQLWVRPVAEFNDGRFEILPATPTTEAGK